MAGLEFKRSVRYARHADDRQGDPFRHSSKAMAKHEDDTDKKQGNIDDDFSDSDDFPGYGHLSREKTDLSVFFFSRRREERCILQDRNAHGGA